MNESTDEIGFLIKNSKNRIILNCICGMLLACLLSFMFWGPRLHILYSVNPQGQCSNYMKNVLIKAYIDRQVEKTDMKISEIAKHVKIYGIPHSKFERYRDVVRAYTDNHYDLVGIICLLSSALLFVNLKRWNKLQLGYALFLIVAGFVLIYYIELFSPNETEVSNEYFFVPNRTIDDLDFDSSATGSLKIIGYCKYCDYPDHRTVVFSDGSWKVMSLAAINERVEKDN